MGINVNADGSMSVTSTPGFSGAGTQGAVGESRGFSQPAATRQVTPSMDLNSARQQADQAFSGLVSPMSLTDIRSREAEQKATSAKAAESQFNPQIAQEQKTGMATVSTAEGVTGQNQGFNISTAEAAYLAGTQQEVNTRVKYVEDQKAAAISTGNLAAIQRADDQLAKLNEYNNQLTIAKANYALQLMSGNREQAQLELAQQQQVFNQKMAEKTFDVQLAELTGDYQGSPTFAAKQATIQNELAKAGLTGTYNGTETLEARTARLSQALAERGMVINEKQLAETIRSNRVQEGLAGARLAQGNAVDEDKLTDEEKSLQTDLSKSISILSQDKNKWGQEFNYIKNRYNLTNEETDQLLHKESFYPGDGGNNGGGGENNKWYEFWK